MKKSLRQRATVMSLFCCFLTLTPGLAAASPGWQWYNEAQKQPEPDDVAPPPSAPSPATALQKLDVLQKATKEALVDAILYPNVPNFVKFFQMQRFWQQQAGLFSQTAKKAMLEHPELDYNLEHSHYNGTVKNQLAADYAEQRNAIQQMAQKYGVMFFYRGRDPIDTQLVGVIKNFRETYGLSVIPVSVDGVVNPQLPDSRQDAGQAATLGVRYFPALMLVDPASGSVQPLSYGFISQDELAKQFLNVFTDFKPNF